MLLFIQRETEVICSEVPVSIHLMLLFIEVSGVGSAVVEAFQYISCYSLSTSDAGIAVFFCVSIHLMLLFIYPLSFRLFKSKMFQYISCYSLSQQLLRQIFREDCFNTSHVTLYRKIRFMVCSTKNRFNTSHVTLYRRQRRETGGCNKVSIHLMLLFIGFFQINLLSFLLVSIHLMLLFIKISGLHG